MAERLGYWREPNPRLTATSVITWRSPGPLGLQVWVGTVDGRQVATIKRHVAAPKECSGQLDGWMWTVMGEGTLAERMGIKESSTRGFRGINAAKRALQDAIRFIDVPMEPIAIFPEAPAIARAKGKDLVVGQFLVHRNPDETYSAERLREIHTSAGGGLHLFLGPEGHATRAVDPGQSVDILQSTAFMAKRAAV